MTEEIKGKDVIEVGSRDVNGSLRSVIKAWGAKQYIGVDIMNGPGVDTVCDAESLVRRFGPETFDIVISTEMVEHVKNWREAISNIKQVCKPRGIVLLTTRSKGYGYHGYPFDFWRYEPEDMKQIFSDFEITTLERDSEAPGVFLKARKPENFHEADLSNYGLYSILQNRKVVGINEGDVRGLRYLALTLRENAKNLVFKAAKRVVKRVYPGVYYG